MNTQDNSTKYLNVMLVTFVILVVCVSLVVVSALLNLVVVGFAFGILAILGMPVVIIAMILDTVTHASENKDIVLSQQSYLD